MCLVKLLSLRGVSRARLRLRLIITGPPVRLFYICEAEKTGFSRHFLPQCSSVYLKLPGAEILKASTIACDQCASIKAHRFDSTLAKIHNPAHKRVAKPERAVTNAQRSPRAV